MNWSFLARPVALARTLLTATICVAASNAQAQTPVAPTMAPVASFFQNSTFTDAALSPDGRHVAMLVSIKNSRVQIAVMDVDTRLPKIVAGFNDADVHQFHWVGNDRLVFDTVDRQTAQGDTFSGPGLFSVNRNGAEFRRLVPNRASWIVERNSMREQLPWNTFLARHPDTNTPDEVYVLHPNFAINHDLDSIELQRLNVVTGRAVSIKRPAKSREWLVDETGVARITSSYEGNIQTIYYRDGESDPWRKIAEFDYYSAAAFAPYAIAPDGTFYVTKAGQGRDKAALYKYDLAKQSIVGEPIVALADYDFRGSLVFSKTSLLGVRYETDAESTTWFDPAMKKIQQVIDEKLPSTVNQIALADAAETPYMLVHAYSDTQPGMFILFNSQTQDLTVLGRAQPAIDPTAMASKDMVRYKARDGLEIPAWLTLPKGGPKKDLPMVVLVHGGPYVRGGHWRWDGEAQFLASRGYAVLEPEFRGSTGFGWKHFRAGWKQWGLGMQNDVADGTRWAIAQHIADPKRICIAGASYGGYATLMGLINDPELYRCGIDWVGVTDIDLLYSVTWSDDTAESKRYGIPRLVGDRVADAAQLKATSPLERASEIKQPLLLAYGGSDRRVPIVHGTKFRDAVKRTNNQVEWIEYPEEGHGWYLVENRVDFWTRVEAFLKRNIGQP
ncbi:MAG: prolyl oligopeptidase family serine peptidase [Pseudomonadota bacterium]|nr:prolyl oligopeptidase family serine peptidase [Pseudomonadota bacterium]